MSMIAGSCTIATDGTITGTGLAKDLADAWKTALATTHLALDGGTKVIPLSAASQATALLGGGFTAAFCNAAAAAIVSHITTNAEVTVKIAAGDSALQRTPNPNNPTTDTLGPSGTKTLATKGTIA